ncbi:MAG: CoA-acylating methylmalonate-semialdehyde dehydrogenase [Gammaproteobacteria bacterium]|nr:CoA-acylating methylmalonate-semialdehyde dehydrogenase [Gammaproteobacteria bacterium]
MDQGLLLGHWIAGALDVPHDAERLPVYDPTRGVVARQVTVARRADVDRAVSAAKAAQRAWATLPALQRARLLARFAERLREGRDDLARLIAIEHGKTLSDALGEVARGLEVVEFAAAAPQLLKGEFADNVSSGVDSFSVRAPLGVVAGITPFNFPVMVPLWMLPIALVCGNTFVLKPSERDPSAALWLAAALQAAGVPDGVVNVVQGDKTAVDALLEHPDVAAISFVGSTAVARDVQRRGSAHGKRVQALGSAKNHLIVMPDADLDAASEALLGAAYGSAGERCMAISVAVAVGDATADALLEKLRAGIARIVVGPSLEPGVDMGPLVTAAHRARVLELIDSGIAEGAQLAVDGRGLRVAEAPNGFFLGPSLFDRVSPHMRIYREEIFGPVLSLVRVPNYTAAVDLVNAHPLANGSAMFTRDGETARQFALDIEVGMVGINVPIPVPAAYFSFGGWRQSLFGDHNMYGADGVRFYTRVKTVTQRWPGGSGSPAGFAIPHQRSA